MTVCLSCPPPGGVGCLFPSKPPAPGRWQECLPPSIQPQRSSLPSPRRGQPAGPKIATANKEMSSLGLLSLSAGAHFFQLWFKLRNTNVFLVSALCQHFCRACSGATGGAHKLSGEDFEKQFLYLFFPLSWSQGNFSVCISLRLQGQEVRAGAQSVPVSLPGAPLHPCTLTTWPSWPVPGRGVLLHFLPFLPYKRKPGLGVQFVVRIQD